MLGCLLLDDNVTGEHYLARYEWSRGSSPFNTALYATRSYEDRRITLAFGQRFERRADGVSSSPLEGDERTRTLVEEFGYSEAIIVPALRVPLAIARLLLRVAPAPPALTASCRRPRPRRRS